MNPTASAPHLARLRHRIGKRFSLKTETFTIEGRSFNFTRVTDPDTVLDQICAEEERREKLRGQRLSSDELQLPYWAELWDSAIGISAFLLHSTPSPGTHPSRKRKRRIRHRPYSSFDKPKSVADASGSEISSHTALDLGCGMGFTGMVAQSLGYHVTMADIERDCLLFAALNAPGCRTRRLDWRKDRLGERFDLIIGADVLYDKTQWQYLEPFWRAHLAEKGSVLLGEPGRQTGDLFVKWIDGRGWEMERFEQAVSTRPRPIRLFRLQLR